MTSISVRWMNLDTPMKHQMKHHQVFIWDETCFSSEIKHLHFNEINFLLFHLRRHVKNSGFVLYHGFQIPRNRWKHSACGLVLSSVSQYLEPVIKHSPSFLTYYFNMCFQWSDCALILISSNITIVEWVSKLSSQAKLFLKFQSFKVSSFHFHILIYKEGTGIR